jgi:hypothetical protein
MAQHDYVIDNQTAPNFRADLNSALAAIVSTNSGASDPSTTYGNMMWYDTTAKILKMRNEADDAWIDLGTLDQVAKTFAANVVSASQAEAQAGTNNTRPITPLRLREGLNASGSAPIYACRAWVNFNGTNGSIRASGNVSSVTRSGVGNYFVNFTTNMPDANYSAQATIGAGTISNASESTQVIAFQANYCQILVSSDGNTGNTYTVQDATFVSAAIFR